MLNTTGCMRAFSVAGGAGGNCSLGALSVCVVLVMMSTGDVTWPFVVSGLGAKIPDPCKNLGLVFGTFTWANPTPLKRNFAW